MCELTILMPCLNEAETLALCINKAKQFLADEKIPGEILIADNGSTDGSIEIAQAHGVNVVKVVKRGYGAALKAGIEQARGEFIIMGDADASYDFYHLKSFINKLREGYELVMGNRFAGGIQQGAMPFLNRYLGNPVLSFFGRKFFNTSIHDFHCGLRGFHRQRIQQLNLQGDGMEFASEMIVKASLQHLRMTEVPIILFPDGRSRAPHLRPWRDGWRHLRLLLLFSPRWLFFYPGIILLFLGLLVMSLLAGGPLSIGQLNFDIHTMLFASLFSLVGVQAVFFAIFSQWVANFHLGMSRYQSFNSFFKLVTLERGLIIGLLLTLLGAIGSFYIFWYWQHYAYGPLLPTKIMRILIPSVTLCVLGVQTIFASFFLSLLQMHYQTQK